MLIIKKNEKHYNHDLYINCFFFSLSFTHTAGPIISSLAYDNITHTDARQELKKNFRLAEFG